MKSRKYFFLFPSLSLQFLLTSAFAQTITGNFSGLPAQQLKLLGFDGLQSYTIDSAHTDAAGNFSLRFGTKDYGMGILSSAENKSLVVVLSREDVALRGEAPELSETIHYTKGAENKAFGQYAREQPIREQAMSAWIFLQKMYTRDSLFLSQKSPNNAISSEIKRLKDEEAAYLNVLPKDGYVKWYLPVRKLVSNVSLIAQYRPEEIPATLKALRALNYSDGRLFKSGLFKETLESHVWFIENSSGPLDSVYADLNKSIDIILAQFQGDEKRYNMVTEYLFNFLEKRSLFTSSEYLALKVLNEQSCTVHDNVAKQLEGYRKMKKGSQAPDISFGEFTYYPEHTKAKTLYEIGSKYTIVAFAAGWCPHCTTEIPKLAEKYAEWHDKGVEIVLVALDEDPKDFARFAAPFPFISTTEYKKWETKAARDYFVFGTPTLFLLDKDKKIVLRPKSVDHAIAWLAQSK